jgi:hypothetical protein
MISFVKIYFKAVLLLGYTCTLLPLTVFLKSTIRSKPFLTVHRYNCSSLTMRSEVFKKDQEQSKRFKNDEGQETHWNE